MSNSVETTGITLEVGAESIDVCRRKIICRVSEHNAGMSISLMDEIRGIMIEVPVDAIEELLKEDAEDGRP